MGAADGLGLVVVVFLVATLIGRCRTWDKRETWLPDDGRPVSLPPAGMPAPGSRARHTLARIRLSGRPR